MNLKNTADNSTLVGSSLTQKPSLLESIANSTKKYKTKSKPSSKKGDFDRKSCPGGFLPIKNKAARKNDQQRSQINTEVRHLYGIYT